MPDRMLSEQPTGCVGMRKRCLDLGEAGFQQGIFACKISGIHEVSESRNASFFQ